MVSPSIALAWGGVNVALSLALRSDFRDGYQNRLHLMETLSKLLPLAAAAFEPSQAKSVSLPKGSNEGPDREKSSSTTVRSATQQPQMSDAGKTSASVELTDQEYVLVEETSGGHVREATTSDPSKSPRKEGFEAFKRSLEAGHFDLSKLDQQKFKEKLKDVVQQLLTSRSLDQVQGTSASSYIILGWFPRGSLDPKEKLLKLNGETNLFKEMKKGIRSVRGWRRFLSLKSLHNFGLYRVRACELPSRLLAKV